jgi:hypothetical protein
MASIAGSNRFLGVIHEARFWALGRPWDRDFVWLGQAGFFARWGQWRAIEWNGA